jgi:hypothetical protein
MDGHGALGMNFFEASRGAGSLPFFYDFYEPFTPADARTVARQMQGRKSGAAQILGTANRCRFGFPRVIVCAPLQGLSDPFPTSFWLTCPRLVRSVSQAESAGGVHELERWIALHAPREWIPFNLFHYRLRLALLSEPTLRFLRRFHPRLLKRLRGGVGGLRFGGERQIHVKCLHLQTASWLALRRHPGASWLAEAIAL